MTEKSKKARNVVCVVVSFLLSVFLFLSAACILLKTTALSGSFAVRVAEGTNYEQALHAELKEQFISYGNAGNVDASFFDGVFESIVTPELIAADTQTVIHDFYNGAQSTAIDTTEMQSKLSSALLAYAEEKGYAVNAEMQSSIEDMAAQFGALYNSFTALFSNSYFQAAGSMLSRYTPYINYAILGLLALSAVAALILRMAYKKRKNVYRYYIYAVTGTALMLFVGPAAALILRVGNRINLGTASLYGLASGLINGIFISFLIAGAVCTVAVILLAVLRNSFVKKNC